MTAIDTTGHTINRNTSTKIVVSQGVLAVGVSARFAFTLAVYRDTPATIRGSGTKIWPTFLKEVVNQALNQPPSKVSLKKARWSAGTMPMTAPKTAPSRGAFKKSYRKRSHQRVRGWKSSQ